MRRTPAPAALLLLALVACSQGAPASSPAAKVVAADAWVRATDGAQRQDMTAVFVNLTNPTGEDRRLTGAGCGDVAATVEIHEMVKINGKMVMRKAGDGLTIKAGKHEHLAPGGPHIMLMGLTRTLPAGSEELKCTLTLDDGQRLDVLAPVKQFTEEQDTYHTHDEHASPSPSQSHG